MKPGELLTLAGYLVGAAVFVLEARRRGWRMERTGWVVVWTALFVVLALAVIEFLGRPPMQPVPVAAGAPSAATQPPAFPRQVPRTPADAPPAPQAAEETSEVPQKEAEPHV